MTLHVKERLWRLAILGGILLVGCFGRFYHLDEQGFLFSDEGTFAASGRNLLLGAPQAITARPGHALLVCLSFWLLGFSLASAATLSAVMGLGALLVLYLLGNRLYGPVAGLVSCALAAFMPYLLLYHRVALTEANYLFFMTLGFALGAAVLVSWAGGDGPGPDRRSAYPWLLAAGAVLGYAYDIKPPGLLGLMGLLAASVLLCLARRLRLWDMGLACLLLLAGAFAAHAALLVGMRDFVSHHQAHSVIRREVQGFLGTGPFVRVPFQPGLGFVILFSEFAGLTTVVLAAWGAAAAVKRRSPADLAVLSLAAVSLAYSIRANLPMPRVHAPLIVPVVLLGGLGGDRLVRLPQRAIPKLHAYGLAAILVAAIFAANTPTCVRYVTIRSGYEQACLLLDRDKALKRGAATPSSEILSAFTGVEFVDVTEELAEALNPPQAAPDAVLAVFQRLTDKGVSHLVTDYLLWRKLTRSGAENWRRFVESHPPSFAISSPVISLKQVRAECQVPEWASCDRLAHQILIHMLR